MSSCFSYVYVVVSVVSVVVSHMFMLLFQSCLCSCFSYVYNIVVPVVSV